MFCLETFILDIKLKRFKIFYMSVYEDVIDIMYSRAIFEYLWRHHRDRRVKKWYQPLLENGYVHELQINDKKQLNENKQLHIINYILF